MRSVISSAVIWCVSLSVVLLNGAYFYQLFCYVVRSFIISVVVLCVELLAVLLHGAYCYH